LDWMHGDDDEPEKTNKVVEMQQHVLQKHTDLIQNQVAKVTHVEQHNSRMQKQLTHLQHQMQQNEVRMMQNEYDMRQQMTNMQQQMTNMQQHMGDMQQQLINMQQHMAQMKQAQEHTDANVIVVSQNANSLLSAVNNRVAQLQDTCEMNKLATMEHIYKMSVLHKMAERVRNVLLIAMDPPIQRRSVFKHISKWWE